MKVLILTSLYEIVGRENVSRNTSAIHYLLKYWPKDAEIRVIMEYHRYAKHLLRYTRKSERQYLLKGYDYTVDDIPVHLIELPLLPKQKKLLGLQKKHMVSQVNRFLEKSQFVPDVIICHQPTCYVGQYVNQIKTGADRFAVLHMTDIQNMKHSEYFVDMINQNYSAVFCRSAQIADHAKALGIAHLDPHIIYSGVPEIKTVIRKNWDSDQLNIVYAGKLSTRKHVDMIIKALAQVNARRKFHFYIIGYGYEENNLKKLCRTSGLEDRVTFTGKLPREQVYEHLGLADLFVMPSINETLGLVYLEAMRQTCIPIGTRGEGIDGIIVDGQNGFLVPPGDTAYLAQLLSKLLDMPGESLKALAEQAKETGDQYDEKKKGSAYYALIKAQLETR